MIAKLRSIRTSLASLFVFGLFLCTISCSPSENTNNANGSTVTPSPSPTASPSPTPVDCTKATPGEIVKTIYRELEPMKLGKSAFNFNISAKAPPELNIIGWSDRKADIMAAIGKAAPACTIDDQYFYDNESDFKPPYQRVACPGGYMPCGDICIPTTQSCSWAGTADVKAMAEDANKSSVPVTNSNVNSKTAVNATSNSNTNTAKKP